MEGSLRVFTLIYIPQYAGLFEQKRHYCDLVFLLLIVSLYSDVCSVVILKQINM